MEAWRGSRMHPLFSVCSFLEGCLVSILTSSWTTVLISNVSWWAPEMGYVVFIQVIQTGFEFLAKFRMRQSLDEIQAKGSGIFWANIYFPLNNLEPFLGLTKEIKQFIITNQNLCAWFVSPLLLWALSKVLIHPAPANYKYHLQQTI